MSARFRVASVLSGCVLLAFALLVSCNTAPRLVSPETIPVVLEGVVVDASTYGIERMNASESSSEELCDGRALPARVRLENADGTVVEADCDDCGRFRVGPLPLAGRSGDRLVVSAPGSWSLCVSELLPEEARDTASEDVVVVRRRIALPRRTDSSS